MVLPGLLDVTEWRLAVCGAPQTQLAGHVRRLVSALCYGLCPRVLLPSLRTLMYFACLILPFSFEL